MNLTHELKVKILIQFKTGSSMAEIGQWYEKPVSVIEEIIRQALIEQETIQKLSCRRLLFYRWSCA